MTWSLFREIENRNVVSWTAIIAACQQHGHASRPIVLFEEMLGESETLSHYICLFALFTSKACMLKGGMIT
jgi:hypothetical protein